MDALGFLLSLLWLALFVRWRGRGSLGMKSVACIESLPCTLIAAAVLAVFACSCGLENVVYTFLTYSEALALVASCGFLVLALIPDPNPDTQGTGLSPLKGE